MKYLICLILMMGIVGASCTEDNNFLLGSEINICTQGCLYQNESNFSDYNDCDSSVTCLFSAFYENGTLIKSAESMQRNGTSFNYSLGNLSVIGTHTGQIFCYRSKGWMPPKYFDFTISEEVVAQQLGLPQFQPDEVIKESILSDVRDFIDDEVSKYGVYFLIPLFLVGLLWYDLKFGKEKRRKRKEAKKDNETRNKVGYY